MAKTYKVIMNILRFAVYNNPKLFNLQADKQGRYTLTNVINNVGEPFNINWSDITEALHSPQNDLFVVDGEYIYVKTK